MIYSRLHDFLFLKGRKVAGTSIEIALSSVCGPEDILTPLVPSDELLRMEISGRGAQNYSGDTHTEQVYLRVLKKGDPTPRPLEKFTNHMSLEEFIKYFGSLPTERIFCSERSPYAKVISGAKMEIERFKLRNFAPATMSLDELRWALGSMIGRGDHRRYKNIARYRDSFGRVRARVLRFENLDDDFAGLMREYGISPAPVLPHAKPGIGSGTICPSDVLTRKQLDKINSAFEEEFEAFGYEML